MKKKYKVFLSYNKADRNFAKRLSGDLLASGIDVWFDEWDLRAGESIPMAISNAINECTAFLIIMSPDSMKSHWVKEELGAAIKMKIDNVPRFIIPILLRECQIPALLDQIKYIDFQLNYGDSFVALKNSILGLSSKPEIGILSLPGPRTWKFFRWEVDVRIVNSQGDAEYQTCVCLKNESNNSQTISPMHSVWAPSPGDISINDIRAYDNLRQLHVDEHLSRVVGSFTFFRVRTEVSIPPQGLWRYWFEISWPSGFPNLIQEEFYTYKGESDVDELILKIVMPPNSEIGRKSFIKKGATIKENIPWLKIHGLNALVLWESNVLSGETIDMIFNLKSC